MKKTIILLCALFTLSLHGQDQIMVITDPHVLAQSLIEEGTAFDEMMDGQRKMIDLSEPAFMALIDTALAYKPSLLLIPGDLTKDSEMESHNVVLQQLKRLNEAGIKTLVMPGNHDINGPAYAYKGNQKISVPKMTDSEWDAFYAPIHTSITAQDNLSHSYVAEPLPGLTILSIDGSHGTAGTGSIADSTLQWLLQQADSANQKEI